MSAEALRAVMKRSTCRGPELLVQLAIAHLSDSRHGHYPATTAKQEDIAKVARLSLRRTKGVMASLLKHGRLFVLYHGKGQEPNTYELPIRGVFREVSKMDRQAVSVLTPVIREVPYTQNPRAECTQNDDPAPAKIIRYPKPRRTPKKGTA